jgi:4-amino-4-deoxy-L-arabinose transferase-like glycosyltransferase
MKSAIPVALTLVVIVQAGLFIANSSGTSDETVYWRMTDAALNHGDRSEFGRKGVAPLPALLAYAVPVLNDVSNYAQAILMARFATVAFAAVPTVLIVYFWMAERFSVAAAATAAVLTALSPNIVAHGSIATTDAAFVACALATLWALARYVERPGWKWAAALAAAGGVAFAAKYSAVMLAAVTAIVCLLMDRPSRPLWKRCGGAILLASAMIATGLALTWNYQPIDGLLSQISHQRLGHDAYLLGRRSNGGWWYYQLFALAVKSTYVELAALAGAFAAFAILWRSVIVARIWCVAFTVLLALAMMSHVDIGVRYVLLLIPLALMAGTALVATRTKRPVAWAVGLAAVAVQTVVAAGSSPRQLSYFNGFAGGPMNGYRLLADSNLDWGQDLPAMRRVLTSVGAREPLAAYFGSAPPDDYDVHVWLWEIAGPQVKNRADWIVISATYLDGLYLANDPYELFRSIEPSARPTPTLFVYSTDRPDVKAALAQAMARRP